jgi:hypothetical protein
MSGTFLTGNEGLGPIRCIASTVDSLNNGARVTSLSVCGATHREDLILPSKNSAKKIN